MLNKYHLWFACALLWSIFGVSYAQPDIQPRAAVLQVIAEDVYLLRAGAQNELPLREGSIAPVGTGDVIRTGENGRALITFLTDDDTHDSLNRLYLLPDTRYTLREFSALTGVEAGARWHVSGMLEEGIVIQQFTGDVTDWDYTLITSALEVVTPSEHFAVWAVSGRLEAAISASGALEVLSGGTDTLPEPITVPAGNGIAPTINPAPQPLNDPLHAAQLLALSIGCTGTVQTGGADGLRLRRGAALDYVVVDALRDGQTVRIVGITENELWVRIPYQTGFGWLYRSLIDADTDACPTLTVFSNLVGEANETITRVTDEELPLLIPFYGVPLTNPVFYR